MENLYIIHTICYKSYIGYKQGDEHSWNIDAHSLVALVVSRL